MVTYGGQFLIWGPPVEDLREPGLSPLLVAEHLLEAGRGEHEVAETEHVGARLQHNTGPITLDLGENSIMYTLHCIVQFCQAPVLNIDSSLDLLDIKLTIYYKTVD